MISISLVNMTREADDDDDDDDDVVDFVEQDDGTRVEVKQKNFDLGEPVENVKGGRIYRVVGSPWSHQTACTDLLR